MPEREFIADACSKHNSRSSPALVTIWGSIDMLIGSRKIWLADHSYSYLALEQFNRRLSSVWSWLSRHCFHLLLSPIYRLYERDLDRQVRTYPMPRHIGLILDGNRRYGRKARVVDPHEVYMAGANKLDELLEWCVALKIPAITLWVLSTENLKRPREEVTGILSAIEKKLTLLANDHQIHNERIRVRAVGCLNQH